MKRALIITMVIIGTALFCLPVYAEYTDYRDARLFGKAVTEDIVYGTLLYRDNQGQYITKASQTYFRVQPLYERHRALLTENVGKTVVLLGRMSTSYDYNAPIITYHDVKPVESYDIDLQKVYYYSTMRSVNQSYGIELSNNKALADLLATFKLFDNPDSIDISDEKTLARLINYKDNQLRYQWLIEENSNVKQLLRNQVGNTGFIEGNLGKNILVRDAGPHKYQIIDFMQSGGPGRPRPQTDETGIMTVFGRLSSLDDDMAGYQVTGVVGFTLEDWIKNFKDGTGPVETWKIRPFEKVDEFLDSNPMEINENLWLTGHRWELKDENGNPTGIFYFSVDEIYTPRTVISGMINYFKITNGELVF